MMLCFFPAQTLPQWGRWGLHGVRRLCFMFKGLYCCSAWGQIKPDISPPHKPDLTTGQGWKLAGPLAQMCLAHQAGQRKRYSSLHQRKSPGSWNLSLLPLFQTRHSIKPRWYPSDILTWWYFNPVIVWPSSDRGWARKDLFQCRDCSLS